MTGETVTYSLETILTRIEGKIDRIDERLTRLEIGQATLTEKVEGMDNRLKSVEGTQKNQVWTLIILLGGAIATAGWRSFFGGNP
jgi:septal ring factor EnvC (AmiA/AmiB activator)